MADLLAGAGQFCRSVLRPAALDADSSQQTQCNQRQRAGFRHIALRVEAVRDEDHAVGNTVEAAIVVGPATVEVTAISVPAGAGVVAGDQVDVTGVEFNMRPQCCEASGPAVAEVPLCAFGSVGDV